MANSNGNGEYKRQMSRKWALALLVVVLATVGAFFPPLFSAWFFNAAKPLVIVSGTEWVSVITMVTAAYIGGNVWQKHVESKASASGQVTISTSAQVSTPPAEPAKEDDSKKEA